MKAPLNLRDISTAPGNLAEISEDDLIKLPIEVENIPWKPLSDETRDAYCCLLDDMVVLHMPKPKTARDEEELVNRCMHGMPQLLTTVNNWTFLRMLETSMNYCA